MQPCDESRAGTSILLVDESAANLTALESVLAPLGHHIVTATSGEEALAALAREDFALVLLDVCMPGLDGLQIATQLKARPRTRKVPIIFLTAADLDAELVAAAYAQGGVDFIAKPFDARVLRSKAATFIDWYLQSEENKRSVAAMRRRFRQRYEEQTAHRVRNLTDGMPLGVWAATRDGRITYTNKAWTEYTGLDLTHVNDRGHLDVIHPDDRERVRDAWTAAVKTGEQLVVEYRLRRKSDGAYRWHLGRAVPDRGPRGAIVGWIATATDIDDQKHAEERMAELAAHAENVRAEAESARAEAEAARAEAEAASRMKDEFLATLSHELRTPLNAIYGWTRMVRAGELSEAQAKKAIETIERNTKVQIKLVEDLLDVSRIVAGKLDLDLRSLSPGELVRLAVEAMTPTARAKDVRLTAVYDPTPCRVSGDPNRLQQVVWNLLANAIKFTPAGGRVEVIVGSVEDHVEIEVNDSGHGIAPEFLPHVFDAFRQADGSATRTHGGLGLGLAIVKHIVEAHRGRVEVDSAGYGRGARFVVRLPLLSPERAEQEEWSPRPTTGSFAPVPRLKNVQVLVVDDDADSRDMLSMILEQYGARVAAASTANEALVALGARRFDVLLSDIGMPGVSGYDLMRRIRSDEGESGKFLPAIALTGYATPEDGQRALDAGFQLHMPKPIDPAELLELIGRLLEQAVPAAHTVEKSGRVTVRA
jgi:PAS domain S-box-containing protein